MNLATKVLVSLVATTAGIVGLASGAMAGEGGAAGSAAFTIGEDGQVRGVAVSAAVGKLSAFAGAFNDESENTAFAMGSGGRITVEEIDSIEVDSIVTSNDPELGVAQANQLGTIDIDADSDDVSVETEPSYEPLEER